MSDYLSITKPRMVLGNALVAAAAFAFASPAAFNWQAFVLMLVGLSLVMAGGCALNNVYDRDIDARMERTRGRTMAAGRMPAGAAVWWGAVLLLCGAALLAWVNQLALFLALAGAVAYVAAYTPLKHRSAHALWIGALAGAMPPLVGYAAAAGVLDGWAAAFFAFLYLWQLPHFTAIAIYRYEEYAAAGVPLFVGSYSAAVRRRARVVFYASLLVLLAFCALLILQRWMR
jgi:protoheme IX farnesyltransferase